MRASVVVLGALVFVTGCAAPTVHSLDSKASYGYVFSDVSAPGPTLIHFHVERENRSVLGIFPLQSQYNGHWEFELVASSKWLDQVKKGFTGIPFPDVWPRQLPDWFLPSASDFTAWTMQAITYPKAHLSIEKNPLSQEHIRVFICRH